MSTTGWKRASVAVLVAAALSSDPAMSQVVEPWPCVPALHGQWAGPWDLADAINPPPMEVEIDLCKILPQWNEIAHLIVLPPPNDGLVLLLCRRRDYVGTLGPCDFCPAQAFLWNPSDPSNLELTITLPQADGGADEPFCSAHALTSSGLAGIEGGSNHKEDCDNGPGHDPPVGHSAVWIFDNVQFVRNQSAPQFYLNPTPMEQARWYGTAMQRGDDTTMVFGHYGSPPPPGETPAHATRERGT